MTKGSDIDIFPITKEDLRNDPVKRNRIAYQSREQLHAALEDQNVFIPIDVFYPAISTGFGKIEQQVRIICAQDLGGTPYKIVTRSNFQK